MRYDIAIVGAGIAGASLAAEIGGYGRVLLIEAEDQPGYHATGRSAAFWSETYGGPLVQPLTSASYDFLSNPPLEFADRGFLTERGALHIADSAGAAGLERLKADFADSPVELEVVDRPEMISLVPGLDANWSQALFEPSCADIDVARLHQGYLGKAKRAGVELVTGARVMAIGRQSGGWELETTAGDKRAAVIVNAAGAWADEVARLAGVAPLGITPMRRTMIQLAVEPTPRAGMPLVVDALGRFYFKAEGGNRLWLSPHDEHPEPPADTAPHELDIARAIDWFERAGDWKVAKVERVWAGQRSFAPDRVPVYGFDPKEKAFFWCAGQGGFGIQTAPAAARLCTFLLLGKARANLPGNLRPDTYSPHRFSR